MTDGLSMWTVKEAAELVGWKERAFRKLCEKKKVPADFLKIGRSQRKRWFINPQRLLVWIEKRIEQCERIIFKAQQKMDILIEAREKIRRQQP